MQNLYAYQQNKNSAYYATEDKIVQAFTPDWDTGEQLAEEMKLNKKQALEIFKNHFDKDQIVIDEHVDLPVKNAVVEARNEYKKYVSKDLKHFQQNIIRYSENTYYLYLLILQLLPEIAKIISNEWQEKQKKKATSDVVEVHSKSTLNLVLNQGVSLLKTHQELNAEFNSNNVSWKPHIDELKRWYRDRLKTDEDYQKYITINKPNEEQDLNIVNHIIKKLVLKDEILTPVFEAIDICWSEDRNVVKSMLKKTLNSINLKNNDLELAVLSPNWEEDLQYCIDLFKFTIKDEKQNQEILSKRIKNWEIDRIATIDYILLQMAISEMVNFPNIPVKVTINEFIEISKNYSTPKSKTFINGVLDVIASELTKEEKIRKSGRGLIDNK